MDNNPLFKILTGIDELKTQIQNGELPGMSEEMKQKIKSMTPEQKAEFEKQFKDNPALKKGLSDIDEKMKELKQNISQKMNHG